MIQIANINPIRIKGQNDFFQESECYKQKWQPGDKINVQFMADESFEVDVFDCVSGLKIFPVQLVAQPTNLVDVDFEVIEMSFNVDDLPDFGSYFFRIKNSDGIYFDTHPFSYQLRHENTVLLYYRNTENDFNVVFETGIEYYLRVEGIVHNYSPKLEGDIYFDQIHSPTLLTSNSYKTYNLQVGLNKGIPTWVADVINEAFSCDIKQVNNVDIERNEGADWEVFRVDNYSLIGLSIEILKQGDGTSVTGIESDYVLADEASILITDNKNKIHV